MAEDKKNPLKAGLEVDELAGGRGGTSFSGRAPYPEPKVAARNAGRKAAAEAELNSPEAAARREARKEKFRGFGAKFAKGGPVPDTRDYKKKG